MATTDKNMNKTLEIGKRAERLFKLILEKIKKAKTIDDVTEIKEWQDKDVDYIVEDFQDIVTKYEAKSVISFVKKCQSIEDVSFFVEMKNYRKYADGTQSEKWSGWYEKSEADYFAFPFYFSQNLIDNLKEYSENELYETEMKNGLKIVKYAKIPEPLITNVVSDWLLPLEQRKKEAQSILCLFLVKASDLRERIEEYKTRYKVKEIHNKDNEPVDSNGNIIEGAESWSDYYMVRFFNIAFEAYIVKDCHNPDYHWITEFKKTGMQKDCNIIGKGYSI